MITHDVQGEVLLVTLRQQRQGTYNFFQWFSNNFRMTNTEKNYLQARRNKSALK